eukprot:2364788-Pyramimonas_sp.AAC.1
MWFPQEQAQGGGNSEEGFRRREQGRKWEVRGNAGRGVRYVWREVDVAPACTWAPGGAGKASYVS